MTFNASKQPVYIKNLVSGFSWTGNAGQAAFNIAYSYKLPTVSLDPNNLSVKNKRPLSDLQKTTLEKEVFKVWSDVANVSFKFTSTNKLTFGQGDLLKKTEQGIVLRQYDDATNLPIKMEVYGSSELAGFSPLTSGHRWMMHELGHALGLGDVVGKTSVDSMDVSIMSYKATDVTGNDKNLPITPMIYDIAAIQYLYGANYNFKTDDTKYVSHGYEQTWTIWDGFGKDTLDASSVSLGSTIDLRGGVDPNGKPYFSTINGADGQKENIAIAFDPKAVSKVVDIENGYGGAGNDTIYGGYVGNLLKGNGGADKIYGGLGIDSLYGGDANDTISGGFDSDKIYGDAGNDLLTDRWFKDYGTITGKETSTAVSYVFGGGDNDTIVGGRSVGGKYYGDDGDDVLIMLNSTGKQYVDGGLGKNRIWTTKNTSVTDSAGNDYIWGNSNTFTATDGTDRDVFIATSGKNRVNTTDSHLTFVFDPENAATAHLDVYGDVSASQVLKIGDTIVKGTYSLNHFTGNASDYYLGDQWYASDFGNLGFAVYTADRVVAKFQFNEWIDYVENPQIWFHGFLNIENDLGLHFTNTSLGTSDSIGTVKPVAYTEPNVDYYSGLIA